jgi:hypothetical protein
LRYCEDKGAAALRDVYSRYDRLFNFFYPGRKPVSGERAGAGIKKTRDKPQAPFDRATASSDTPEEIRQRLKSLKKRVGLMSRIKKTRTALDRLSSFAEPVPGFVSKPNTKPLRFGSYG